MEVAPSRSNRVANSCLGALPAAVTIAYEAQATGAYPRLAALPALVAFTALAVRGYRAGVVCGNGELTVRGWLWTRVIPRKSITGITDYPAVRWTDARGRNRWSPMWVLQPARGETARTTAAKRRHVAAIRHWARDPNHRRPPSR
ncbi:hypothetical protein [Streptomyces sp.]|uniref:hypothetical protein n=1 Tax=Streptomyces sp. TaxID=1931 RepID=UPI002F3EFE0A